MYQQQPFYNPFAPAPGTYYAPQPAPAAPSANTLPAQQILQAAGKGSVDKIRMAPNSSALVMDTTAPLVWVCTSDSLGNVTAEAYDISKHKEAPAADVASLESRIAAIEKRMEGMTGGDQSDARSSRAGKDGRAASQD